MADDVNPEIIGGISVSITGDYSSLQDTFADAVDDAQQAGEDISDALAAGSAAGADAAAEIADQLESIAPAASDAGDALDSTSDSATGLADAAGDASDATDTLSESADNAGESASEMGDELDDASESVDELNDSSEETGTALAEMAEQMAAVGEALIITEGLTELGSEALAAADSITTATIALTNITGSAETAHETIEQLEELGMQDGLAMPSLLTAAQRMEQMLPPGTDVVGLLGNIADGAAAMGSSVDQASTRFDQIINAGTLSARSLTSLGLSLTSVAASMNQVNPSADATATTVTAMFKAMDPGQRITVLQTALQGLGGTAQQVAQQTFGGQWQQLADAWESVMVQVGQAILPVITDLTSFIKVDIVPFIQGAIAIFNEFPEPLRDTAVAIALVTAAVIPVTGGLAALGLAVNGLSELMPAVTGLMEAFGMASSETAVEETAAAVATEGLGVAAATAEPELAGATAATEGLGTAAATGETAMGAFGVAGLSTAAIIGVTLVSGIAAAAFGFSDLQTSIKAAQANLDGLSQSDFNSWLTSAVSGLKTASISVDDLEAEAAKLKAALDVGAVSAQQYATAIDAIDAAIKRVSNENMSASISQWTSGLTILSDTTAKASDQESILLQIFNDATKAFSTASAQYQAGTITAEQYEAAVNKLVSAQQAYNAEADAGVAELETVDQKTADVVNGMGSLATASQIAAAQTDAQNAKLQTLSNALITAQEKLVLTQQAQDALTKSVQNGTATQADYMTGLGNLVTASDAVTKAQTSYDAAVVKAANDSTAAASSLQTGMLQALQSMESSLPPAVSELMGLVGALGQVQADMPNFGVVVTAATTGPLAGLQSALTEASAKVADLAAQMQTGANVGQQYEKALTAQLNAQIALDQESALLSSGLQGATDSLSLATIGVDEAQAKYNDLVAAWQNGMPVLTQLDSAQKALTTAQTALNTAVGAASPLIVSQMNAQNSLVPAVSAATAAVGAQTQAVAQDMTAMQTLASAIQSVEQDFSSLVGAANSATAATQGFSGGANTVAVTIGVPGMNQQISFDLTPEGAAKQMYADGYTPSQISHMIGQPLQQVLTWLGLTIGSANTTSTAAAAATVLGSSSSGSYTEESPIIVSGTLGTSTTATTATTSTAPVTTESSSGTAAIDGGSYPAVTAHQAAGEIWAVNTEGVASVGTGATSPAVSTTTDISTTIAESSTTSSSAVQAAATAIGGAVTQLATTNGGLGNIAQSLIASTAATQEVAEAVAGLVERLNGVSTTSSALPGVTGSSGEAAGGTPFVGSIGNESGYLPTSPITGLPTGGAAGATSLGTTVNVQMPVNISGSLIGGNTSALMAAIQTNVQTGLVAALRASGARF